MNWIKEIRSKGKLGEPYPTNVELLQKTEFFNSYEWSKQIYAKLPELNSKK